MGEPYSDHQKYLNYLDKYAASANAASGSEVDANANVENKTLVNAGWEMFKKDNIKINRLGMYQRIKSMYGEDLAEQYIKDLESHLIYRNDESGTPLSTPYCAAITMYPFLLNGLRDLGGSSGAPKNLQSFLGSYVNLVFAVSALIAGAVATPEVISYFDYFVRKEYGDDYYLRADEVVDLSRKHRTIGDVIDAGFQQIVYCINQPAGTRGLQSPFTNFAIFDKYYFNGIFEDFCFPDGTPMQWESVSWLQKRFMKWLNAERKKKILTFPVVSVSLLTDGENYLDQEWADFVAEQYAEGDSFFVYQSDNVDSLSSCCFAGNTKVLAKYSPARVYYGTIKELYDMKTHDRKNLTVFHNGSWCSAKVIRLPKTQMYNIRTVNGKEVTCTGNHLWPTVNGLKRTDELTEDDWLMFNCRALSSYAEADKKLTYEEGVLIGMYLGDGSTDKRDTTHPSVHLSINETKYALTKETIEKALRDIAGDNAPELTCSTPYNNMFPCRFSAKHILPFIREYVTGDYCFEKALTPDVFTQSEEFRKGILDGWYITDGGNSNRIYTTSKQLAETGEALCTSLGIQTRIDVTDRTDEKVVVRGAEFSRNFPLYCIRFYGKCNKRKEEGLYKVINNSTYFKIENVIPAQTDDDYVYCFERYDKDEPYFTLPNGLITHNCRLRNEIQDNQFSYTLGAGGVSTGSKCVMTINMNRLVQSVPDKQNILDEVRNVTKRVHMYLKAFNSILEERTRQGMIPLYTAGYVTPDRQYLTVGINGFIESAEYLGYEIKPTDERYSEYANFVFKIINDLNKADREPGIMFNCEQIPAENVGVKFHDWDVKDGLKANRNCYNSYFFIVEDPTYSVFDKLDLHGKRFTQYLDGGSACHINLEEHLTKNQYAAILKYAIKAGCPYFTFNIPNTVCKDCGHISKHYLKACPKCGGTHVDYATRIIGYLKLVSSYSLPRQQEAAVRHYGKWTETN